MKDNNKHIICTTDKATADQLRAEGFVEVGMPSQGRWTFVNDFSKQVFSSNIDESKVSYTNIVDM